MFRDTELKLKLEKALETDLNEHTTVLLIPDYLFVTPVSFINLSQRILYSSYTATLKNKKRKSQAR